MAQAMRGTLRKLGVTLGLIGNDADSFGLKAPQLYEILKPSVPNIEELSEEDVSTLINEAKASGGGKAAAPAPAAAAPKAAPKAAAGPAKPGPKKAAPAPTPAAPAEEAEEAVEDHGEAEEEAPAPAPKAAPAKPGPKPGPAAPAKPGPAAPAKPGPAAPAKPGPAKPGPKAAPAPAPTPVEDTVMGPPAKIDLKPIIDRIDTIGTLTDANSGAIKKLQADVSALLEIVKAVDSHLAWQYNNQLADDGEPIQSLTAIEWTEGA